MSRQKRNSSVSEVNPATVSFIKDLCTRISEALEEIDDICTEQLEPKPQPSPLGSFEGIGLFSYVKSNEEQYKEKYPAFTDNQIVSILLMKWQSLSNQEKLQFCQKLNLNKLSNTKKLKKLNKKGEKLRESFSVSEKYDNPRIGYQIVSSPIKKLQELQSPLNKKQQFIQGDCDTFFDEPPSSKRKSFCKQLQRIQEKESEQASNFNQVEINKTEMEESPNEKLIQLIQQKLERGTQFPTSVQLQNPEPSAFENQEVVNPAVVISEAVLSEAVISDAVNSEVNESIIPIPSLNQPESISFMPSLPSGSDSEKNQKLCEGEEDPILAKEDSQSLSQMIMEGAEKTKEAKQISFNQPSQEKSQETPAFPNIQFVQELSEMKTGLDHQQPAQQQEEEMKDI